MSKPPRLPDHLTVGELLDVLDDSELEELVRIAFHSGDLEAVQITLRAIRRLESDRMYFDPDQLHLFNIETSHASLQA